MLEGEEAFDSYFSSIMASGRDKDILHEQAIAVLDDRRLLGDVNLVFTFNSIIPIRMRLRQNPAKYREVQWKQDEDALDIGGILYNNPNVHVKKIGILAQEIAEIREEFENAK